MTLPKNPVMYLKLSDRMMMGDIKPIMEKHHGNTPVCLYFEDTKERLMTDKNHGVTLTNALVAELCDTLGSENVKIK